MNIADNPENYGAANVERALVSKGDTSRLENLFKKALSGKTLTIAFLGGSITQGCHASAEGLRYVERVHRWFRTTFPMTDITCINAGVGATTSLTGVHRVRRQILDFEPDLVIVDFAVNDTASFIFRESYESLIRDLVSAPSAPAIVELFMIIDGGINEQAAETHIGLHYAVPMISYRNLICDMLSCGEITWNEVSADEVHPNDTGHGICAGLITGFFSRILSGKGIAMLGTGTITPTGKKNLPDPIYSGRFCGGTILAGEKLKPANITGFVPDADGFQIFRNGWKFEGPGTANITIALEARNVVLLYKKSVQTDSGTITVRNTGIASACSGNPIILNTFFRDGWGDYAETKEIARSDSPTVHRFEISAEGPVMILGFLVS